MSEETIIQQAGEANRPALYDDFTVALAVFLGSPLPGGWLMYRNFMALGQRRRAVNWLVVSILGTLGLISLGLLLPDTVPHSASLALNTAICACYASYSKTALGQELEWRKAAKTALRSRWWGVPVGAGAVLLMFGLLYVGIVLFIPDDFSTPADDAIREKVEVIADLEQKSDAAIMMIDKIGDEPGRAKLLGTYSTDWRNIERLCGEAVEIAREADRPGLIAFMEIYRQLPPLKIEMATEYKRFLDYPAIGEDRMFEVLAQITAVTGQIELFFDTLDDEHIDVLYLLP